MQSAKLPKNEIERLNALIEYDILDTEAEQVFDDLTELASEICETPISLISLVDPDRQWFKAKVGLDADETSREIAFCSHAILQDDIFEVPNALEDERFNDNPLVAGNPDIRFYAGMPLKTPTGFNIGTLCVISDQPKKLTSHQKKALAILGREVISQLELRIQNKKLALANNFKTQFLANVSHEIRTPLNAIIGLSDLLLKNESLCDIDEQAQAYIKQISFSGDRLLGIINSVLDLGKIEAGKMELENTVTNLPETINNTIDLLQIKAKNKGVLLTIDADASCPDFVYIDRTKLSQVLSNILNNAIKFTPSGKQVCVNYGYHSGRLQLTVCDQGVGISAEDQTILFDKYAQVGKKKSSQEGTGLGLSITKGLVELMGGNICLSSTLGQGTNVTIALPLSLVEQSLPTTAPSCTAIPADYHILAVEDNKVNQIVLRAMLDKLQINNTIVDSGEEALTAIETGKFDLILMDINLPGIDGIEVTQAIRQAKYPAKVIALTADVYRSNDEKALFDDFLTKPIQIDSLSKAINLAI